MQIAYPQDLPVVARHADIRDAIAANQVVIIAGDTGSGKTTQIPKICLELFADSDLLIGCTQPRRIAASSVSARVSEELGPLGEAVGYKIRFHDYTTAATRIKFMTDGVLLAETRNDPLLRRYGVIVLDEAHERSLNIDFLLGYLKGVLPRRPDLKLIVTSATIDTEAFSAHFNNAPVIEVSGRTYPVTVRYQPGQNDGEESDDNYVERCAEAILAIHAHEPPGDILAFLPTEKDIRTCCDLVAKQASGAIVLPMFGRLQAADQRRIFQHFNQPKIVIATNVAETSITVPGIRYVVDSGLARMSFYNARAKTTSLPVHRISRASCDQRKGRCGRVGPGICVRLYTEEDYLGRDAFTPPEITRANLAEVILQMVSLQLGRPDRFPFIDPPHKSAIRDGYTLLQELGAITGDNTLTPAGRFMADLPIDPCISRILLEAKNEGCLAETKIIASALAIQDPRIRPAEKEKQADEAHRYFAHKHSDFMTLLNIWHDFQKDQEVSRSWSRLKKYCTAHYLSFQRMREWMDLHEQLGRLLARHPEFSDNTGEASYQQIHKSLAAGFLRNVAVKKQAKLYQGAGNRELMIFPGSHQFLTAGQWIMAASFIETNRLYALTVATIEPDWLESLAPHLISYSWSNPRWNKKSGQVVADEKASLFGLTIVAGRQVNFARRDERNIPAARAIFIEAALIEGNIVGNYPFLEQNLQRIEEWRKAEDKLRTTTIVQEDGALISFYDRKLPEWVCDRATLNRYLKKKGHRALIMRDEDIVQATPDESTLADYPSTLEIGSLSLPLLYSFSPGSEQDGVTVRIPIGLIRTLRPQLFEWLVPGLLKEKVHLLLKGLPKSLRRHLVPVNLAVERILDDIDLYKGSLYTSLADSIFKLYRIGIQHDDWPKDLPHHLSFRFLVYDHNDTEVASGRDLSRIIDDIGHLFTEELVAPQLDDNGSTLVDQWRDRLVTDWDFDGLVRRVTVKTGNGDVAGFLYATLTAAPSRGGVTVDFVSEEAEAVRTNIEGVGYLFRLQFTDGYKSLKKYCESLLTGPSATFLTSGGFTRKEATDQLLGLVTRALFPVADGHIPERETFYAQVGAIRKEGFYQQARKLVEDALQLLKLRREVQDKLNHFIRLDKRGILFTKEKREMFNMLLHGLVPVDFFRHAGPGDIEPAQRQLQSLAIRIERYYANPAKDMEKARLLAPHLESLRLLEAKRERMGEETLSGFQEYQKLVAEYRIAVFSPELKTRMTVSAKKLNQLRQRIMGRS